MYRPQICRPEPENECFYDQLQYAFAKVPATEILIPVGDWNSHIGAPAGVFSDAHGGHCFGTRNTEGERILELAIANGLRIGSTSSKKRDHTWSHTLWWPLILNRIDYIFYCKSSAVQSATWKSSIMKNASNSSMWWCVTSPLTSPVLRNASSHPTSKPGS